MKKPDLSPHIFKYRVMRGEEIIGQFSNLPLAEDAAHEYRGVVLEYQAGGKWIETREK